MGRDSEADFAQWRREFTEEAPPPPWAPTRSTAPGERAGGLRTTAARSAAAAGLAATSALGVWSFSAGGGVWALGSWIYVGAALGVLALRWSGWHARVLEAAAGVLLSMCLGLTSLCAVIAGFDSLTGRTDAVTPLFGLVVFGGFSAAFVVLWSLGGRQRRFRRRFRS